VCKLEHSVLQVGDIGRNVLHLNEEDTAKIDAVVPEQGPEGEPVSGYVPAVFFASSTHLCHCIVFFFH
jgi:hypothetical protein